MRSRLVRRYRIFSSLALTTIGTRSTTSREPYPSSPASLRGLFVEYLHLAHAQVLENLRADAIVAYVGSEAMLTFASTVSRPSSWRWYAFSLLCIPSPAALLAM